MQIINDISYLKKKLSFFKDISANCKIGKYSNGEYYIVQPGYFQRFWRFYYNENRENTCKYLDKEFTEFVRLLDTISIKLENNFCVYSKHAVSVIRFIDDIIPGLYNLKKTYTDTIKMVAKIDSIILTLIDFKENFNKYQKINYEKKKKYNKRIDLFRHSWEL